MSRTYKDAPYWVKLRRNAIDKEFAKTIKSGLVNVETLKLTPNTVYNFGYSYRNNPNKFPFFAITRKRSTKKLYSKMKEIPGTETEGFSHIQRYEIGALKLREIAAEAYKKATGTEKSPHEFSFITQKLSDHNNMAFIPEGTKTLIGLNLARYYSFNDKEYDTTGKMRSILKLSILVYEINGLNENHEIEVGTFQYFDGKSSKFAYEPSLNATKCSCEGCKLDDKDYSFQKKKLPLKGGKATLRKRLNEYKLARNLDNEDYYNDIEDLIY